MTQDFKTHIVAPKDIPKEWLPELLKLIIEGGQVHEDYAKRGIERADLIAVATHSNDIVSMAVMKNPLKSYRDKVFEEAKAKEQPVDYSLELGYIVTKQGFEGRKICQALLSLIMSKYKGRMVFATTRKPEMVHILKKYGFEISGSQYDGQLSLMVLKG